MWAGLAGLSSFMNISILSKSALGSEGQFVRRPLAKRELGRTGEKLSIIGLGGVVYMNEPQEMADRVVKEALDYGVNYFDVAPTYGNAEELLGPSLKPYRDRVFLACKTQQRDALGAEEELHRSLRRLGTDHVDLYQLHALTKTEDVDLALGPRGAVEAILKAREEGKVRFIGFSAHSSEAALRAMSGYDFDTILFPVNYVCMLQAGFGQEVVRKARGRKMGILAIKALARQPWPDQGLREKWPKCWYQPVTSPEEANLALRFSLSQPITAAVPPGDVRLFRMALGIARDFSPLNSSEEKTLRLWAASLNPLFKLSS